MDLVEGLFWVFIGGPVLVVLACLVVPALVVLIGVIMSPFNTFFEWVDSRSYERQLRKEKFQNSGPPDPPLNPGTKAES